MEDYVVVELDFDDVHEALRRVKMEDYVVVELDFDEVIALE